MKDHDTTIAGVTDGGHYYCTCGRKVICTRWDSNGRPVWRHTSGTKRIDGRLVLDSGGESVTVDVPRSGESFVRVAGVPFDA